MNRRDFLKISGCIAGAAISSSALFANSILADKEMQFQKKQRPNIILILADDMGFADIGCYGSEIQTPTLDALAAGGIRFTQFYNGARCCPTRASLITGLHPHQAGIGWMTDHWGADKRAKLDSPAYSDALNHNCVTIAEALKLGGYHTLMSGKWHVGYDHDKEQWPVDRGFDRSFALIHGASSYFKMDPSLTALDGRNFDPNREGFYITDEFTNYAVKFIEESAGRKEPFFLYLPFTSPHWPLHAKPKDIEKYRGKYKTAGGWPGIRSARYERMKKMGIIDPDWALSAPDQGVLDWNTVDQTDMDLRMAVYAAQIDCMDQNIGRVVQKLKDLNIRDNTLILFLADNGACAERYNSKIGSGIGNPDSDTAYRQSWANTSNVPFRRYKHWTHEGGISTPLIANWPAVIKKQGIITDVPGHIVDIMATCLNAAQTTYPKTFNGHTITPLEGKSLLPVFKSGTRSGHEYICIEHEGHRCCRKGKWKIVALANRPWELYDMEKDRSETNNLAIKYPEKITELETHYNSWAEKCGVRPPSYW